MDGHFLVIKVKEDREEIINRFEASYQESTRRFYNVTSEPDKAIVSSLTSDEYSIIAIIFQDNPPNNFTAKKIFLGTGHKNPDANLSYQIKGSTCSELVIKNFISCSGLDLKNDFSQQSYITLENSQELLQQIEFAIYGTSPVTPNAEQNYLEKDNESNLNELSRKNQHCIRVCGLQPADYQRGEYQRDRERIVHAKAFRRLVDKAQIFSSSKGDHYRTRMTHTLEVSQIARGIAIELNVNLDLTEAIALAHDIGHTPFGHQGERTLDDILTGAIELLPDAKDTRNFGSFKHNLHGLRVLSFLEQKYLEHDGLDLSYQVLEGVLKHTDFPTNSDFSFFLIDGNKEFLYPNHKFAHSIEGQIVSIADEIAQRGHDLDDALAAHHLTLENLQSEVSINKMQPIKDILVKINESMEEAKKNRRIFDKQDMLRSRLVPEILGYFIRDVVAHSRKNMKSYGNPSPGEVIEELVTFSPEGKFIANYLKKIISKKVLNSSEVSRFDDKARRIIAELFRAYYNNPKLLPESVLHRLYGEIRKVSDDIIDFRASDPKIVADELKSICFADVPTDASENSSADETIMKKRKALVRSIVDFIAGMTDNFAINEYNTIILAYKK